MGLPVHHQLTLLTALRTAKFYAHKPREAIRVERREWGKFMAGRRLRRLGLTSMCEDFPSGAYPPDWADLLNLYEIVRRRKPKVIIEFGSGCSTLTLGRALFDNAQESPQDAGGIVYSIETSRFFANQTRRLVPTNLSQYIQVCISDTRIVDHDGTKVIIHNDIPDVSPDLVYLDGPNLPTDCNIGADAVVLEESASPDYAILVDGRKPSFRYTQQHLKRKYRTTVNLVHHWELLESIT